MTLEQTRDAYMTSLCGLKSENTLKAYRSALDRFIAFVGAYTPIEQIGKKTVEAYRSRLLADGCSPNGAADYMRKAAVFFTWAVYRGYVSKSPISAKDLPKKREIEYNLLSKEQIEQTDGGNPLGTEQILFGSSADRSGHDQPGLWHPMSSVNLEKMIALYLNAVFEETGIRVHDLRHAYASYLMHRGAGISVIKDVLGHANIATTQRYMHTLDRAGVAAFANAAFGA